MSEERFLTELEQLLNRHCIENESNTPDYVLSKYVRDCLHAFMDATNIRDRWYGVTMKPAVGRTIEGGPLNGWRAFPPACPPGDVPTTSHPLEDLKEKQP